MDLLTCISSWDAFENILNQCLDAASGPGFKNEQPNGNWQLGDEWYWIHINNTVAPKAPLDLGSDGEKSFDPLCYLYITILIVCRYMFGPNQYCQGFSPGGSSCTTIPEGCYIVVPTFNVAPQVKCGV
jgi:hypothetical protein